MKRIIIALALIFTLSACNTEETPKTAQTTTTTNSSCEVACKNYKTQCLQLVPGATQQLYKDGIESCMNECKEWTEEKTGCIAEALDCTSMTDICEL